MTERTHGCLLHSMLSCVVSCFTPSICPLKERCFASVLHPLKSCSLSRALVCSSPCSTSYDMLPHHASVILNAESCRGAYDGKGNAVVKHAADISAAVESLGGCAHGLYAERWAPFVKVVFTLPCYAASPL